MGYDKTKYYLGTLCNRRHEYLDTKQTLRYKKTGHCYHCAKINSNKLVELKCSICKQKFKRTNSNAKRSLKKYKTILCSKECSSIQKKTSIKVNCQWCGKKFFVIPHRYHSNKHKKFCCNRECYKNFIRKKRIENRTRICHECNKKFLSPTATIKKKYCSKQCQFKNKKTREQILSDKREEYKRKKEYYKRNADKHNLLYRKNLHDIYIKNVITRHTNIKRNEITPDMIQLKRKVIILKRQQIHLQERIKNELTDGAV